MNKRMMIYWVLLALCFAAMLAPVALVAQPATRFASSSVPTPSVLPTYLVPWRPTPLPATATPAPGVPPAGILPGLRLYLPLVTSR